MDFTEFQAEIIRSIQTVASPALDFIFEGITIIGEELFIIPIVALIFWCVNKEMGYWLCWCLSCGNLLTNSVKGIVKADRPIGYEGIRTLREQTATSYSFPSGHTQASANTFTAIARAVNRKRFWAIAIILPALVGISRLYLGVHWPVDVVAGYIMGFGLPLVLWLFYRKFAKYKPVLFLISTLVFIPFLFVEGDVYNFWKAFGFGIGLAIGSFIETKFIKFEIDDVPVKKRAIRYVIGLIIVIAVYLGMKALLPSGNLFGFIRYACIPVAAIAGWPAVFKKIKL